MLKALTENTLPRGLYRALVAVWHEMSMAGKHRVGRISARKFWSKQDLSLNIGCGKNIKPGWVNIDFVKGADLALDIREPLPFKAGSCAIIYSEHVVEHLDYPIEAMRFFKEAARVLKLGGIFSLAVPDAEREIRAYANGDHEYFDNKKKYWNPTRCETPMEVINFTFRQWTEHKFAYDFETLKRALVSSGFSRVDRREFDPCLDSEWHRADSLYIEAQR